jgi:PhnB protein
MNRVSTYLNFPRSTEDAFSFYRSVFKTEFSAPIARFKDVPPQPGCPPLAEADKNLVMHVELSILGGHVLMGTDAPESMGLLSSPAITFSSTLSLTRVQKRSIYSRRFRTVGKEMPLQEMFWGGYFGSLVDRFGIHWMFVKECCVP